MTTTHPSTSTIHIWVTKYALTSGIVEYDAQTSHQPNMVVVPAHDDDKGHALLTQYFHTPDWHTTREAAVARAEEMRAAKLKSLTAQIAKLSKLTF